MHSPDYGRQFHVCCVCGKKFYIGTVEKWVYRKGKDKILWFCGWNCMNKYHKENPKKVNLE